ncbi:hypothetical protein GMOD_00004659 [Pyrenophora seminiperda CCB06]|uniref:Uncharacterized protein n=1 Tax=Pyrenophora seminiperda CCB06 TaxID=1302712 RepID=A0A3M7MHA6_9PLEO|nr:hypothetical protein GMOD_00004659 [Pyrenophora seminiperda CCB06]
MVCNYYYHITATTNNNNNNNNLDSIPCYSPSQKHPPYAFNRPSANMYQNLGRTPNWDVCFSQTRLTEENLRSHSSIHSKADSACQLEDQQSATGYTELYYRYDGDFAESDDGDADAQRQTMALRRAASLEVLKAYGGCFASGFLALQEPLPTRAKSKLRIYESADGCEISRTASIATSLATSSSSWGTNLDSPRPDSATLSSTPVPEATKGARWRWRSMKKSWKCSAKKVES